MSSIEENNNHNNNNGSSSSDGSTKKYVPPSDMNKHLTLIIQQMNSTDLPVAVKGYNSFIEQLKYETYQCHREFIKSCQKKSPYNLNSMAKKAQQQQSERASSRSDGLIQLESDFYVFGESVYSSSDYLPVYGGLNRDSILIQYILRSPQLHELKKVHELFNKLFAEKDYETGAIFKKKFFFMNDLIFKYSVDLDKKTEWAKPNSPHEHEYRLVKQALGSYANFVLQECWYAHVILFQKLVGHEMALRHYALSTLGLLARHYDKQFDVFDLFKDKFLELRAGGKKEDLHTLTFSLMSHGDARIISTMTSKITFDWSNWVMIDFSNGDARGELWSVLSFFQGRVGRNEMIELHAKRQFLTKHINNMIQWMDPIMYEDSLGVACSNLMQVMLADLLINNKYALASNDPSKFRYLRELDQEDSFMCKNLAKFSVEIPSHANFVRRVLLKRQQYILPFFGIIPPFTFDDSLESMHKVNFLMTLSELPLPSISKQDILDYDASVAAITDTVYIHHAMKVPDNMAFQPESMTVVLQVLLSYFARVESIIKQIDTLKKQFGELDAWRRFEMLVKQSLKQQFPVSFITFYEYYFIHLTKAQGLPKNVHDFLLGRCLQVMRLFLKYFVTDDLPATILNLFQAIVPSAALVYQYTYFISDLRVQFAELLAKDMLSRLLTIVSLDGSSQRGFSRKMLSPIFIPSNLFSSQCEFNTWMRTLAQENVPFVTTLLAEVYSNQESRKSVLTSILSPIIQLDDKLFGQALLKALEKSLDFDSNQDLSNIQFVYRLTALQLLNSKAEHSKMITECFENICKSKDLKGKNLSVFSNVVRFLNRDSKYDSQFESITMNATSLSGGDQSRSKSLEPMIFSLLYSNIHVPLLKELQVQKFLGQKFDVSTSRTMSNLFSNLPFDILFYQHELSVDDKSVSQYLESFQQYIFESIARLGDLHEHISAVRQAAASFFTSNSPLFASSVLISLLQSIYKKFAVADFIEVIKVLFGGKSPIHQFLSRANSEFDVALINVWSAVLACGDQPEISNTVWEQYFSKLCTAVPSKTSNDKQLVQSVIDLIMVLPVCQSQQLMRVMLSHKSPLLVELLSTHAIQNEKYRAVLSSIVLNDRVIFGIITDSLADKERHLLPLFHAIVSYAHKYVLQHKQDEASTYQIDPFVCIESDLLSSLLKDVSKSEIYLDTCAIIVANSCAYDEVTLSYIHSAIKKHKTVSAEAVRILSAYVHSLVRVKSGDQSKLVLNDVLLKDIITECQLLSKLYRTISDSKVSMDHCRFALEVAKFITEQSSANLSDLFVGVLSEILSVSSTQSDITTIINHSWSSKEQYSMAQVLFVEYLLSGVQKSELKLAVVLKFLSMISRSFDKKSVEQKYYLNVMVSHVRSMLLDSTTAELITLHKASIASYIGQFCTTMLESACLDNNDFLLLSIDLLRLRLLTDSTIETITNQLLKESSFKTLISKNADVKYDAIIEQDIGYLLENTSQKVGHRANTVTLLLLLLQLLRTTSATSRQQILENNSTLLPQLLSIYGARLSERDLILYDIFTAFEISGAGLLYKHYYAFGSGQAFMNKEIYESQGWNNFKVDNHFLETIHNFPNRIKLYSNHESVQKSVAKVAHVSELYDPRYLLRWILFLTIAFNNETIDTAMFTSPALALAVRATGSKDHTLRQLAYEILARISLMMKKQLRNAKSSAKKIPTEYSLILGFLVQLKASVKSPYKMLPNLMALFLSKIAYILRNPADAAYAQCVRYFTRTSSIKLDTFPIFQHSLFASMSSVGYDWLMDFLLYGASDTRSAFLFEHALPKKNLLQEILLLFDGSSTNSSTTSKVNAFVIRFLRQLSTVDNGALCVSNGVLSWCAQQLNESAMHENDRNSLLEILTTIVDSYNVRSVTDSTSLVNQIHTVIRAALSLPMSNKLVFGLLNSCFVFIHKLLSTTANQELRNKPFVDIQTLQKLMESIDCNSRLSIEYGLEIIILSTLAVPSLNSYDAKLVASRLCGSEDNVQALVSVIQRSLLIVHRALDQGVLISSNLPEFLLRWLACIIHCVSSLEGARRETVVKLIFFKVNALLLPFYSRESTRTLNAIQSLNFIHAMTYPYVSSDLSDKALSLLNNIPLSQDFLDMKDFRSYSKSKTLQHTASSRPQKLKINNYLAQVHYHASVFFRRVPTFETATDMSDDEGSLISKHCPTMYSTIEWFTEKMDDIERPESLQVEEASQDDLYDYSLFDSGYRKPTTTTLAPDADSDSDSDSDESSDSSDSESDDEAEQPSKSRKIK